MTNQSPPGKQENVITQIGGYVLALLFFGVGVLFCCWWAPIRSADVHFRAAWMLAHWNDEEAFPRGCAFCMAPFCLRSDTTEKYAGGRKGFTSEFHYHYCPDHESSFAWTESRFDEFGKIGYWFATFLVSFLIAPIGMVALRLLLRPLLSLIYRSDPDRPERLRSYIGRYVDSFERDYRPRNGVDWVEIGFGAILIVWTVVAWGLFIWY